MVPCRCFCSHHDEDSYCASLCSDTLGHATLHLCDGHAAMYPAHMRPTAPSPPPTRSPDTWRSNDGTWRYIRDMKNGHLLNAVRYIERQAHAHLNSKHFRSFQNHRADDSIPREDRKISDLCPVYPLMLEELRMRGLEPHSDVDFPSSLPDLVFGGNPDEGGASWKDGYQATHFPDWDPAYDFSGSGWERGEWDPFGWND